MHSAMRTDREYTNRYAQIAEGIRRRPRGKRSGARSGISYSPQASLCCVLCLVIGWSSKFQISNLRSQRKRAMFGLVPVFGPGLRPLKLRGRNQLCWSMAHTTVRRSNRVTASTRSKGNDQNSQTQRKKGKLDSRRNGLSRARQFDFRANPAAGCATRQPTCQS